MLQGTQIRRWALGACILGWSLKNNARGCIEHFVMSTNGKSLDVLVSGTLSDYFNYRLRVVTQKAILPAFLLVVRRILYFQNNDSLFFNFVLYCLATSQGIASCRCIFKGEY